jgi:hypothetical protein
MSALGENTSDNDYNEKIRRLRATLLTIGHHEGSVLEPHEWQAECCANLVQKRDVFLTAPTGRGRGSWGGRRVLEYRGGWVHGGLRGRFRVLGGGQTESPLGGDYDMLLPAGD